MSTRVAHHRIVSATMQHAHFDFFTTLELLVIDQDGRELLIELFSEPGGITPTWLEPRIRTTPAAQVADAQS